MDVPEINRRGAVPPHRQIAAWLRTRIQAGEFRPDEDPLPSEKDLVDLFGVARDTARRAVQVLRDEGLVVTVAHRGTYVVPEHERPG
jgi:GntR family transcriptional regulator